MFSGSSRRKSAATPPRPKSVLSVPTVTMQPASMSFFAFVRFVVQRPSITDPGCGRPVSWTRRRISAVVGGMRR